MGHTAFIGGENVDTSEAIIVLPDGVSAPDWLIADCSTARRTKAGWTYTISPERLPSGVKPS